MAGPNVLNGDVVQVGVLVPATGMSAEIAGMAQRDDFTITPTGDTTEDKLGGVVVSERTVNPGEQLTGDFTLDTNKIPDAGTFFKGMLIQVTLHRTAQTAETAWWVLDSASFATAREDNLVIASLTLHRYFSMTSAYEAGYIDPATGEPYETSDSGN